MALLAVSDREPGGDELIRTGATAPSTTNTREKNGVTQPEGHLYIHAHKVDTGSYTHTQGLCTHQGRVGELVVCRVVRQKEL